MKCQECEAEFKREERVSPTALAGALESVRYCSDECKRVAGNRRYYQRHKHRIKPTNRERIRARRKQDS